MAEKKKTFTVGRVGSVGESENKANSDPQQSFGQVWSELGNKLSYLYCAVVTWMMAVNRFWTVSNWGMINLVLMWAV